MIRFLDPACGCGNFLVLAYRELRLLELDVLRQLHAEGSGRAISLLVMVNVDQFYGIELDEWPVRIAEVAMWLMDHQMNQLITEAFGQTSHEAGLACAEFSNKANDGIVGQYRYEVCRKRFGSIGAVSAAP